MPTYTGPTPYDKDIENLRQDDPRDTWIALPRLEAAATGYRQAKAEDAPLLEALKALMPLQEDTETYRAYEAEFKAAEEAIAAAEGRVQP